MLERRICRDRKSTRLNSSHGSISYAVFCLKKKKNKDVTYFLKKKKKNNNINTSYTLLSKIHSRNTIRNLFYKRTFRNALLFFFFFFNDTATTEIYTLSLHDALPIPSTPHTAAWVKNGAWVGVHRVIPPVCSSGAAPAVLGSIGAGMTRWFTRR